MKKRDKLSQVPARVVCRTEGQMAVLGEATVETVESLFVEGLAFMKKAGKLDINFGALTRVDSAALALLFGWIRVARQQNILLTFSDLPQQVLDLSRVAGIDTLLPTVTLEDSSIQG